VGLRPFIVFFLFAAKFSLLSFWRKKKVTKEKPPKTKIYAPLYVSLRFEVLAI